MWRELLEEAKSSRVAQEDLWEDMTLELREGKNIPGKEEIQFRGSEMEKSPCSRQNMGSKRQRSTR